MYKNIFFMIFQNDSVREMVFVYHCLKNKREIHMMGDENMNEEEIAEVGFISV